MSKSIILTEFRRNEEGHLLEEGSKNLENTPVLGKILEKLKEKHLDEIEVLEEGCDESYTQDSIKLENLEEILSELEVLLEQEMKLIIEKNISEEEKDKSYNEMTLLLNIRRILLKKEEKKYFENRNVLLILG